MDDNLDVAALNDEEIATIHRSESQELKSAIDAIEEAFLDCGENSKRMESAWESYSSHLSSVALIEEELTSRNNQRKTR